MSTRDWILVYILGCICDAWDSKIRRLGAQNMLLCVLWPIVVTTLAYRALIGTLLRNSSSDR